MTRPKILMVTDSYPHEEAPYATTFFHDHAKTLQRFAHVKVTTLIRGKWFGFRRYVWDGVEVEALLMPYRPKMGVVFLPLALLLHSILIFRNLLTFRPDKVLVHMALPAGLVTSLWLFKRFVLLEHSTTFGRGKYITLHRIVARSAKKILAVSKFLAYEMERKLGVRVSGIIPNPIFPCKGKPKENTSSYVLWVGRITPHKDPILLREAARLLRNYRFVFIGSKTDPEYSQRFLEDLPPNCEYLGPLPKEKVLRWMEKGTLLVSTSTYETFGVAIAEALACGKPVVWTDSGGPRDFLNETNSVLVKERTPQALAEAISEAISKLRSGYFDPERIMRGIISYASPERVATLYRELLFK
ncbi:MAG: glycosyltransferase family 4 protein [Thermotogae bacterium]|nr:glycosyltransferase family 4 protein [Thermotogota bacterium]